MLHDATLMLHIAAGASGLVLGPVAMRAGKRRGLHTRTGEIYHWVMLTVCASAALLVALDPAELWWFLPIAAGSYAFALLGYLMAKRRPPGWLRWHISGQGGSYIALVTALLVVNLGDQSWVVWIIPTLIGSPIITWVNFRLATGRLRLA